MGIIPVRLNVIRLVLAMIVLAIAAIVGARLRARAWVESRRA